MTWVKFEDRKPQIGAPVFVATVRRMLPSALVYDGRHGTETHWSPVEDRERKPPQPDYLPKLPEDWEWVPVCAHFESLEDTDSWSMSGPGLTVGFNLGGELAVVQDCEPDWEYGPWSIPLEAIEALEKVRKMGKD